MRNGRPFLSSWAFRLCIVIDSQGRQPSVLKWAWQGTGTGEALQMVVL